MKWTPLPEKSPPGWKGSVKAMKRDQASGKMSKRINPFALAWSMHKKGAKPHYSNRAPFKKKHEELADLVATPVVEAGGEWGVFPWVDGATAYVPRDQYLKAYGRDKAVKVFKSEKAAEKYIAKHDSDSAKNWVVRQLTDSVEEADAQDVLKKLEQQLARTKKPGARANLARRIGALRFALAQKGKTTEADASEIRTRLVALFSSSPGVSYTAPNAAKAIGATDTEVRPELARMVNSGMLRFEKGEGYSLNTEGTKGHLRLPSDLTPSLGLTSLDFRRGSRPTTLRAPKRYECLALFEPGKHLSLAQVAERLQSTRAEALALVAPLVEGGALHYGASGYSCLDVDAAIASVGALDEALFLNPEDVEVGKTADGYYFKRPSGLKDTFKTLEKMRYALSQVLGSMQKASKAIARAGLAEGAYGPTRIQVQAAFDRERSGGKSVAQAIAAAQKALGVKDVRVNAQGTVVFFDLDEGYQHVHWKGATSLRFKITTAKGAKTVQGRSFGKYIGIHADNKAHYKDAWVVTHMPTGLRLGAVSDDEVAVRVAKSLEAQLGDALNFTDPSTVPPEVQAVIVAARGRLRNESVEENFPVKDALAFLRTYRDDNDFTPFKHVKWEKGKSDLAHALVFDDPETASDAFTALRSKFGAKLNARRNGEAIDFYESLAEAVEVWDTVDGWTVAHEGNSVLLTDPDGTEWEVDEMTASPVDGDDVHLLAYNVAEDGDEDETISHEDVPQAVRFALRDMAEELVVNAEPEPEESVAEAIKKGDRVMVRQHSTTLRGKVVSVKPDSSDPSYDRLRIKWDSGETTEKDAADVELEEAASKAKAGYWRTTKGGHKIYIEGGKITKGNPHVVGKAGKPADPEHEKLDAAVKGAKDLTPDDKSSLEFFADAFKSGDKKRLASAMRSMGSIARDAVPGSVWRKAGGISHKKESIDEGRITVKVTAKTGETWTTGFNGTLADAKKYFVGNEFNVGVGDRDKMVTVTKVELVTESFDVDAFLDEQPNPALALLALADTTLSGGTGGFARGGPGGGEPLCSPFNLKGEGKKPRNLGRTGAIKDVQSESVDEMAKLSARGRKEILRLSRQTPPPEDSKDRIEWYKHTRAYMDDGHVLTKMDARYAPDPNGYGRSVKGYLHTWGWKDAGKLKKDLLNRAGLEGVRAKYVSQGWTVEEDNIASLGESIAPFPVWVNPPDPEGDAFVARLVAAVSPKAAVTLECPACGAGRAYWHESHADTGMDEMVVRCPDCKVDTEGDPTPVTLLGEGKVKVPHWRTLVDELMEFVQELEGEETVEVLLHADAKGWKLYKREDAPKNAPGLWADALLDAGYTMEDARETAREMIDQLRAFSSWDDVKEGLDENWRTPATLHQPAKNHDEALEHGYVDTAPDSDERCGNCLYGAAVGQKTACRMFKFWAATAGSCEEWAPQRAEEATKAPAGNAAVVLLRLRQHGVSQRVEQLVRKHSGRMGAGTNYVLPVHFDQDNDRTAFLASIKRQNQEESVDEAIDMAGARRYIDRIKNPAKQRYARDWFLYCQGKGDKPEADDISVMAAQGVRMQLAEFGCHQPEESTTGAADPLVERTYRVTNVLPDGTYSSEFDATGSAAAKAGVRAALAKRKVGKVKVEVWSDAEDDETGKARGWMRVLSLEPNESVDEGETFGSLKVGDQFRMPDDPANAVLKKTGPASYKVVSADDEFARGLTIRGVKASEPVLPEAAEGLEETSIEHLKPSVQGHRHGLVQTFTVEFREAAFLASPRHYWTGSVWSADEEEAKVYGVRKEATADLPRAKKAAVTYIDALKLSNESKLPELPSEDEDLECAVEESLVVLGGLAIAALVGAPLGKGVIAAVRAVKALLDAGKKTQAEKSWDAISKQDRQKVVAWAKKQKARTEVALRIPADRVEEFLADAGRLEVPEDVPATFSPEGDLLVTLDAAKATAVRGALELAGVE
jgi:hypothetical protein